MRNKEKAQNGIGDVLHMLMFWKLGSQEVVLGWFMEVVEGGPDWRKGSTRSL